MQKAISWKMHFCFLGAIAVISACGNSWMTTQERQSTPAALIEEGQYAYDKRDFKTAVGFFQKAVEKDPNNQEARVKLAYSLNANAGVELYDIVSGFLKYNSSNKNTDQNPLKVFVSVVGLPSQDIPAIQKKLNEVGYNNLQVIRDASVKLTTLHASWRVLCRLIPAEYLKKVVGNDKNLELDLEINSSCRGGLPNQNISTSVLLAAAFGAMAQGAAYFQTALDPDNDGKIDFVESAEALTKEIDQLKVDASAASAVVAVQKLQRINAVLSELNILNEKIKSRLVTMTLAQFTLLEWLIANIPGLPEGFKTQISNSINKFSDARQKLANYMAIGQNTAGVQSVNQGGAIQARVDSASSAVNTLKTKACGVNDSNAATGPCQEFKEALDGTCKNFDTLKSAYNLPLDTPKPSGC